MPLSYIPSLREFARAASQALSARDIAIKAASGVNSQMIEQLSASGNWTSSAIAGIDLDSARYALTNHEQQALWPLDQFVYGPSIDYVVRERDRLTDALTGSGFILDHLTRALKTESSERALSVIESVGVMGMTRIHLEDIYGTALRAHTRNLGSLDELLIAGVNQFARADVRASWFEQSLPALNSLNLLGEAIWNNEPFSDVTHELLSDLVGDQSDEATRDLRRARSLRVRRALYRDLGAKRSVEKLPVPVVESTFRPLEDQESFGFLILIEKQSPLSQYQWLCFALIGNLEVYLRGYLTQVMTTKFGPDWMYSDVKSDLRTRWRRTCRLRTGRDASPASDLLPYSELKDVMELIVANLLGRTEGSTDLNARFARILEIRHQACHSYPLLVEDYIKLRTDVNEIGLFLHGVGNTLN